MAQRSTGLSTFQLVQMLWSQVVVVNVVNQLPSLLCCINVAFNLSSFIDLMPRVATKVF